MPHEKDQWLANGCADFGFIVGGTLERVEDDAPIRLFHGDAGYGAHHIRARHGHWVKRWNMDVPALVWLKCQQRGKIYTAPDEPRKLMLSLMLSPTSLLVLRYIREAHFFTVVTLYHRSQQIDGDLVGVYAPNASTQTPIFTLNPYTPPEVVVKRKRGLQPGAP